MNITKATASRRLGVIQAHIDSVGLQDAKGCTPGLVSAKKEKKQQDAETIKRKKEERKTRMLEERRKLGEERVEDFDAQVSSHTTPKWVCISANPSTATPLYSQS